MSIQDRIERAMAAERALRFASSDQLSLGQIIDRLKEINGRSREDPPTVSFDFEYAHPTKLDSWRGVYSELACGFTFEGESPTVAAFLADAESAVGKVFHGYKGGEFVMTRDTPVWVANDGNAGATAIVDVIDEGYQAVLVTRYQRE